jgi:hypothetical protein
MSAKARKKKAVGERPRLGFSSHLTIQLKKDIIERARVKQISLWEAEQEVVAEYKKRYPK